MSHDYLFDIGGAERVTSELVRGLGTQHVVALGGVKECAAALDLDRVRFLTSATSRDYRLRSLAVPWLAQRWKPLAGNVLASSYAFAHHLLAEGKVVVYCHTPLRQVWTGRDIYSTNSTRERVAIGAAGPLIRRTDRRAARRADAYIATNRIVAQRIQDFYGFAPTSIIPPPVDSRFLLAPEVPRGDYFLWAGRIVEPYKRLSLVLDAFEGLPYKLIVVGEGRDAQKLKARAPSNVRFLGSRDTEELARLYSGALAVIFPSEDDFGMVPIEAMACGTPVVAWRGGGALFTVGDGTGVFFDEATTASLEKAIRAVAGISWDRTLIRESVVDYGPQRFVSQVRQVLDATV